MVSMFDQLSHLHEQGLYSNVITLGTFALSLKEYGQGILGDVQDFQALLFMGEALMHEKEFKRSEMYFRKALQSKKHLTKAKNLKGDTEVKPKQLMSDCDIKFKIHQCLVEQQSYKDAVSILESILARHRSLKVNMALGRLYKMLGNERSAITAYREVLKGSPLALEAAFGLLSLGVKISEVQSLVMAGGAGTSHSEWVHSLIKGYGQLNSSEPGLAAQTLASLEDNGPLRCCSSLISTVGEALYLTGDYGAARSALERAHALDPQSHKGMDMLAHLYALEKREKECEQLAQKLMAINPNTVEAWIATSQSLVIAKNYKQALGFAQKALMLNPCHQETLILKGTILMEVKKFQDAITHFREAIQPPCPRFAAYNGLVMCYIELRRMREAAAMASSACKVLGHSTRALTLYGMVLLKDPMAGNAGKQKAKSLLMKALDQDPSYLPAAQHLAELHESNSDYEAAIEVLKKASEHRSMSSVHQTLADLLIKIHKEDEAVEHYTKALSLDPMNMGAMEGLQRMEQGNTDTGDPSYEELPESEIEADLEDVDRDMAWYDEMDLSPPLN